MVLAVTLLAVGGARSVVAEADASSPAATDSAFVCPSGHNPYDIHLWLHVTKWCIEPGVRKQAQVKVQMMIHNRDDRHWLDIRQDKIRLIVHEFDPDRWTQPRIGVHTPDRPVHTTYEGERVWAVPANAERAYDLLPNQPGIGTFATHWEVSRLAPGATLIPHYHYGDLVFYMPVPTSGQKVKANIVGIAYVKNADIIALCPPDKWEHHVGGGLF